MEEMEHLQNLMNEYFDQYDNLDDDHISMMSGMMSPDRMIELFEEREGRKIIWIQSKTQDETPSRDYDGRWSYA